MTKIVNVTEGQPESCAYCHRTHDPDDGSLIELRPYGKGGAWICFECGMKPENVEVTEKMFDETLKGADVFITGTRADQTKNN